MQVYCTALKLADVPLLTDMVKVVPLLVHDAVSPFRSLDLLTTVINVLVPSYETDDTVKLVDTVADDAVICTKKASGFAFFKVNDIDDADDDGVVVTVRMSVAKVPVTLKMLTPFLMLEAMRLASPFIV